MDVVVGGYKPFRKDRQKRGQEWSLQINGSYLKSTDLSLMTGLWFRSWQGRYCHGQDCPAKERKCKKTHLWKIPHDHNMEHLTPPLEGQFYKVQTILEILAGVSLQMLYGHTEWGALLHMLLTNKEKLRVVRVSNRSDCSNYEMVQL